MKKHLLTPLLLCLIAFAFFGCAANRSDNPNAFGPDEPDGLPRMVISGVVRNTQSEPLSGIRIDLETKDPQPAVSYNYALTDSKGAYTIIRYRGHEQPDSLTLYASDPAGMYLPQIPPECICRRKYLFRSRTTLRISLRNMRKCRITPS